MPLPDPSRIADTTGFWFLGTQMKMHASGDTTGGVVGLIEQLAPAGFTAPPHVHHGEDEAFFVLEGALTFHRGSTPIDAAPGTFVWLPRGESHWFEVHPGAGARLLQLNTPAGLEHFFEEMGTPFSSTGSPPSGAPDFEKLLELASKYRIELLSAGTEA